MIQRNSSVITRLVFIATSLWFLSSVVKAQDVPLASGGKVPGQPFQYLQSQVDGLKANVTTLQSNVATLQNNVAILQGSDTSLQGNVTALQGSVAALQSSVASLESRVTALDREPGTFIHNCGSGQTLNESIRALRSGDTLLVSGTCNENVVISSGARSITLDGQGSATINGPDATEDTVRIGGREITITNFTITGGARGVGVRRGGTTLIDSNIIRNTGEQGIVVTQGSIARIVNNAIENNPGTGIIVTENSSVRIGFLVTENTIASPNTIRNNGGDGIIITRSSNAGIVGNTISGNNGNGVLVVRVSQADISSNTINANTGNGIFVTQNSGVNLGADAGAGIFDSPNSTTANNTLNGIRCLLNSYADGRLGTLNGASGAKNFLFLNPGANSGGCHDSLLP